MSWQTSPVPGSRGKASERVRGPGPIWWRWPSLYGDMQEDEMTLLRMQLTQHLAKLPGRRQRALLEYRLALNESQEWHTVKAIAQHLKLTIEQTRQLEARALGRLRRKFPNWENLLGAYLRRADPPAWIRRAYDGVIFSSQEQEEQGSL